MEDLFSCPVCFQRLEQPKMLQCQHTFCSECLKKMVKDARICCPECRAIHKLDYRGVEGLPNNLTMMKFLHAPVQKKYNVEALCQECKKKNIQAECCHCDKILCGDCLVKHTRTLSDELRRSVSEAEALLPAMNFQIPENENECERVKKNAKTVKSKIQRWRNNCSVKLESTAKKMLGEVEDFEKKETGLFKELKEKRASIQSLSKIATMKSKEISQMQGADGPIRQMQNEIIGLTKECKNHASHDANLVRDIKARPKQSLKFRSDESQSILDSLSGFRGLKVSVQEKKEDISEDIPSPIPTLRTECLTSSDRCLAECKTSSPSRQKYQKTPSAFERVALMVRGTVTEMARARQQQSARAPVRQFANPLVRESASPLVQLYQNKGQVKRSLNGGSRPLKKPWQVAVLKNDNIVVADSNNHRIQIFDSLGNSLRSFGSLGDGNGKFRLPYGVCVTRRDQIIVADTFNNRMQVFNDDGRFRRSFSGVTSPYSVAESSDGLLFVGDQSDSINVFSADGQPVRKFAESWLKSSEGQKYLTITHDDKVVVSNQSKQNIGFFDKSGHLLWEKKMVSGNDERCLFSVASDQQGNIAVADREIKILDNKGNLISSFGEMDQATGVAFLQNGDVVASDAFDNVVRIF